ncbi:MAG: type 2 isopentenyl-diphosphate Delta-isomerase [Lentisphaerae bacterium]|nr:type 2 isopentenyl-diphosphate Delta-isomerase [Lentisphaerota bacterium]
MSDALNQRKQDHLRIVRDDAEVDRRKYYFDDYRLIHRALPELDLAEVDSSTSFMGKSLSMPLLISCMTGGASEELRTINRNLAIAAEATGIAMGLGSQRIMLADESARASFMVRDVAPTALLFGNLGAVQLNLGVTPDDCVRLVADTGMDALCLHLNPLQEAVQPEGDTNFKGLAARIAEVVQALDVPVIVKEVGAGLGPDDAALLVEAGVSGLDVAGAGGTSWSRIEYHRDTAGCSPGELFQDWGWPTPRALRLLAPHRDRVALIASGGIRNGIDMAKAMVLGASLCGMARPFLEHATVSSEQVVDFIAQLNRQFRTAMFLTGQGSVAGLIGNTSLLVSPP